MAAVIIGSLLGCILGAVVLAVFALPPLVVAALPKSPTPTDTPFRPATITLAPVRTATFTRVPVTSAMSTQTPDATTISATVATRTPTSTKTPIPTKTAIPVVQHFLIGRPLFPPAGRVIPNWVYLYGTTEKGDLPVHHGEDFDENPVGTPLYAVADGTVVVAGPDEQPVCGDQGRTLCGPFTQPGGFYGNLVVIQLAQSYKGQPVYALYGHMSKVTATKGASIKTGDPVGAVGGTGVADGGSHLHLEIRLGTNDYAHTRNPILWTTPVAGRGSLAGEYVDAKGAFIRGALVNIYKADGTFVAATETYSRDRYAAVVSDDEIGENFAVGDLPVGEYIVKIDGQSFSQRVTVAEGKLSFIGLGGTP